MSPQSSFKRKNKPKLWHTILSGSNTLKTSPCYPRKMPFEKGKFCFYYKKIYNTIFFISCVPNIYTIIYIAMNVTSN